MKNLLILISVVFAVILLPHCKKDVEENNNNNNNNNNTPGYPYYINYNDTSYEINKGYIRKYPYFVPPAHYLQFYLVSSGVSYDSFFDQLSGEGPGLVMLISTPSNVTTLPVGNFTFASNDSTISSCRIYTYTSWFSPSNSITVTQGTFNVKKDNNIYTINLTGNDVNNKDIVVYYKGTIQNF